MASERPVTVQQPVERPADDGLFGPESVSWRAYAGPASAIAGATAVLMQMLHPRVVRMIDQASSVRERPAERQRLTGEYLLTTIYGDRAAAERAGEVLRTIHEHRKAVDSHQR